MVSTKWTKDNDLSIYEDDVLVGTGKLLLIDGKYFIKFEASTYKELAIRMLVRRAVNMGAIETYAIANKDNIYLFEKIGFTIHEELNHVNYIMCMEGDVKGHCCK